ncbi:MAG: peptidoglycan editing factor PgeF [Granulosicoccus sp.]
MTPLKTLTPDWQVNSSVRAFCTTRLGGVSEAPFDALNLGLHVGDEAEKVMENRRLLQESCALPTSPEWLHQTHSALIHTVEPDSLPTSDSAGEVQASKLSGGLEHAAANADGAWTDQPNKVLAVLTADCLPVVISDVQGSAVAVVHAGWRGLAAGILENALTLFDDQLTLHAWLGPAIGPEAFEVGEDVRQAFTDRNSSHHRAFKHGAAPGKYWCDLYALAREELQQMRTVVISGGEHCTHRQSEWFHSHRRDGARSGRMATMVWISSGH